MYESHFGLSGLPFQLNPDPSFYFDSRGHHSALAYLKFGVHQGEGFIVVTGEIGAGKTTLVRTLLGELDPTQVVAAQIVSTQLEAGELLRSIVTAFGIPPRSFSKADLIATIEAFLVALAAKGRRALLIVDEAQNLDRNAIEELRMLSNFQLGNKALLQSFLVGQPELRSLLLSKQMEQLRQRIIASCHLGPMDSTETRSYIEHRLHKVGWKYNPNFTTAAFDEIFRWTSGVPRRINILCNRLMLAAYLGGHSTIDAELVQQTAREQRAEVGDNAEPLLLPDALTAAAGSASPAEGVAPKPAGFRSSQPGALAPATGPATEVPRVPPQLRTAAGQAGPLLCVIGSRSDAIKLSSLLRALVAHEELPPTRLVQAAVVEDSLFADLELPAPDVTLAFDTSSSVVHMADVMRRFEPLVVASRPAAVLVVAGSDAALGCGLVASRHRVPVLNLESGLRGFDRSQTEEINRVLTDNLAEVLYTPVQSTRYTLVREGLPDRRIQFVGSLLADTVRNLRAAAVDPRQTLRAAGIDEGFLYDKAGYGVVSLSRPAALADRSLLAALISELVLVSQDLPLVWPMHPRTRAALENFGLDSLIGADSNARIARLPLLGYRAMVGLLTRAACVFTDSGDVQEEATVLGLPCLTMAGHTDRLVTVDEGSNTLVGSSRALIRRTLSDTLKHGGKIGKPPQLWDGQTAVRVADHISLWLRERRLGLDMAPKGRAGPAADGITPDAGQPSGSQAA